MAPPPGSGSTIVADANVAFDVSTEFYDLKSFVYAIAEGTAGDLGRSAGMAGDDSTAHSFAAKYQPAATAIVQGIGDAGQGLALTASKLLTMAVNYLETDNAAAARMGANIDVESPMRASMQDCDPNEAYAALPMVTGSKQVHEIPIIGHLWPQGDPDKLRAAGKVWAHAAQLIDEAQQQAETYVVTLTASCSGTAVDAFTTYVRQLFAPHPSGGTAIASGAPLMENLSAACRVMGKLCGQYADAIDTCRSTMIALGATIAAVTTAGVLLTVFTFGGSDAAAAATDAAAAGEAATAAETLAAAAESLEAVQAVAEAESIVSAELARLIAAGVITGTVVFAGANAASAAPGGAPLGMPATAPPLPPIPASGKFPPYTPAQAAAASAWAAGLDTRDPVYGTPDDIAYQIRVAGQPEVAMPIGGGNVFWADGYRPSDGAVIDAKNVRDPSCTPRTLDGLNSNNFATGLLVVKDKAEIARMAASVNTPGNHATYVEIDCSDPSIVGYYQFLAAATLTPNDVRYVP